MSYSSRARDLFNQGYSEAEAFEIVAAERMGVVTSDPRDSAEAGAPADADTSRKAPEGFPVPDPAVAEAEGRRPQLPTTVEEARTCTADCCAVDDQEAA